MPAMSGARLTCPACGMPQRSNWHWPPWSRRTGSDLPSGERVITSAVSVRITRSIRGCGRRAMPSKWLTAFRGTETHFPLNPCANSANSANRSEDAQKSEDFRQFQPAEPCADRSVPIGANSANSSPELEQELEHLPASGPIGTNGTYWHSGVGTGATDTKSAETLGFQPAKKAI